MRIGIIGGGSVGTALGRLFSAASHQVTLGVREGTVEGLATAPVADAAASAELVVLAVPFAVLPEALPPLADALAGKIVVDATNPVNADWSPTLLGQESSAGEEVARLLPRSRVVKAFNTVFADVMRPDKLAGGAGGRVTAFVASDHEDAALTVAELADTAGFAPVLAGSLSSARYLEAMAHLNIRLAVALGGGTDAAFVYDRPR